MIGNFNSHKTKEFKSENVVLLINHYDTPTPLKYLYFTYMLSVNVNFKVSFYVHVNCCVGKYLYSYFEDVMRIDTLILGDDIK